MSTILFTKQVIPSAPTTSKVRIFIDSSDGFLKSIDEFSVVTVYGSLTQEQVEDFVAGLLTSTASISFTYDDSGNFLTADVLAGGVDHDLLLNYVGNQHIDHTSVSINAGTGLSGGGDLTSTRTISMPPVGTPGTYGSATQIPVLTTDTEGRVTSVTDTNISYKLSWNFTLGRNASNVNSGTSLRHVDGLATSASPLIIPVSCILTNLTAFTNGSGGSVYTFNIFKNGVNVETILITDPAIKNTKTSSVAFAVGDEVSATITHSAVGANQPDQPSVSLFFKES